MLRCHEVQVVAAGSLEFEHHLRQLLGRDPTTTTTLAEIEVLAENALEVAVGKENCSGAPRPPQAIFLPEMGETAAHQRIATGSADPSFILPSVYFAIAGTDPARIRKERLGFFDFGAEAIGFKVFEIAWIGHSFSESESPPTFLSVLARTSPCETKEH